MVKVSVSALKAKLSEYLRLVRNGEEVLVTERGLPVARLVPLDSELWMESHMKALVEAGLVRPPISQLPDDFWERPRPADPEGVGLKALLEERREGR